MKKNNPFKCVFLLLIAIGLFVFPFKDRSHSDVSLESNPQAIAINPETDIAVVAVQKGEDHQGNTGYVSVIDLSTQKAITSIPIGRQPGGVAIDRGLNLALITNSKDNTVSVINLNTLSLIKTIPVGKEPLGIAVNTDPESSSGHIALTANHKDDTVSVINLMDNNVIKTIAVGKEPIDIAIDPTLSLALIVNEKEKEDGHKHGEDKGYSISVIDLKTYLVTGEVLVGKKPLAIDINPETHLAAVANEKDNSITVIDLKTWQTYTIPVGKHPINVVVNSLDNRALVICDEDRSLLLIDLDTRTVIKTYSINKEPKGVAVNNFTNIAAITDDKTDSLALIQLPNPISEITSINPDDAQRGSNEITINIEGSGFIKTSSVRLSTADYELTTVFIDNHHIQAIIPKEALLKAGTFPITISNPAPDGGTSNSVTFTVNNPVPSITALEPTEAIAGTSGLTLNIYGTGFFEDTEIYYGGAKKPITYINNTKLQINLTSEDLKTPGKYEIMTYNSPPVGGNSNKVIFTVKNPLEIKITSPTDGDTINKAKIMVKGTIKSDTKDVGITVNGVIAEITGNEWIANNIPLTIGTNTITATATDSYGNTDTKTITIYTNDITQQIELSANITSGISPLQVFFSTSTSFTPVSYQMDFEGDGVIDYTGSTFENISHTYTMEDIFYPTLTVTDDQGNTYSDTIAITVLNKAEIDTLLKGKWEGMKEALANKDVEKAVAYFLSASQERYRYIFTSLLSVLPDIFANMQQAIEMISVESGVAEYRIKRMENVGEVTYYIYFVLDENGLWKILQF